MPHPPAPPPVLRVADPAGFKTQMESTGFEDVEVVSRDLEVADFDSMCRYGQVSPGPSCTNRATINMISRPEPSERGR